MKIKRKLVLRLFAGDNNNITLHFISSFYTRYLDNIIANPTEEKYRKIRINNKVFQEKVHRVAGSSLFIEAIGFQQQLLPHQGNIYYNVSLYLMYYNT